jgi:hypothetical protein
MTWPWQLESRGLFFAARGWLPALFLSAGQFVLEWKRLGEIIFGLEEVPQPFSLPRNLMQQGNSVLGRVTLDRGQHAINDALG